jgi:predicted GNAT family N-acyltransferase
MYLLQIPFGTPEYDQTVQLRDTVLRKPLNLQFSTDFLEREYTDMHLACYADNDTLLGCLVMTRHDETTIQMRQVAVLPAVQRKGVGRLMVAFAEKWAHEQGYTRIILHARDVSVDFYEKMSYQKIGDEFEEVGIRHWEMEKMVAKNVFTE